MLQLENVTCERQGRVLFKDLSLTVENGQLLYIEGVNGAGKTTLLRAIAGLHLPTNGTICMNDIRTDLQSSASLLYVGHKSGLNGELSAIENLRFWCNIHNEDTDVDFYEVLENLGLVGLEDIPVKQLSAGQTRRVALAKLWLSQADLWVLDEPFTSLDSKGIRLITQKIQSHLAQGSAVVMTSHQPLVAIEPDQTLTLEYQL